jgi:hypothetical protein
MAKRDGGRKRRKPIRKGEYGGRAANIAGFVVMGVAVLIAALSIFRIRIPLPDLRLPAQLDSVPARIILGFAALFLVFILSSMLWKLRQVRKTAAWPSTRGRITRSRRGICTPQHADAAPRQIADIEFEYEVAGVLYAGTRPTLAETQSKDDVEAMLARYPVGRSVIVHYDPSDPAESVLERNGPFGGRAAAGDASSPGRGCLIALGLGIAGTLLLMRIVTEGPDAALPYLRSALPNADLGAALFFLVPAALMLMVAWLMGHAVLRVRRWPTVRGEVLSTGVRRKGTVNAARQFLPVVRYAYTVDGKRYENNAVEHGMETTGGESWARSVIARYPPGSSVEVRYNPAQPGESCLRTRFGVFGWITLGIGAALLVLALIAAGLF